MRIVAIAASGTFPTATQDHGVCQCYCMKDHGTATMWLKVRTSCRPKQELPHLRPSGAYWPRALPSLRRARHQPGQGAAARSGACCSAFDLHSSRSRTPGMSSYPQALLPVRPLPERPRPHRQEPRRRQAEPQPLPGAPPQRREEPAQGRPSSSLRRRHPRRPAPPPRPTCASPRPAAAHWPSLPPLAQPPPRPPRCLPPCSPPLPPPPFACPSFPPPWTVCAFTSSNHTLVG